MVAIDMNADIGVLLKNLFSKKGGDSGSTEKDKSPYLRLILIGSFLLLATILYIVAFFIPAQDDLRLKREQIAQISQLKNDIQTLSDQIIVAERELATDTAQYEQLTTLFHTDQELEDLYRHISMLALTHQLLVENLEKADEEPVFDAMDDQSTVIESDESESTVQRKVAFYKFKVMFEITGNYMRYTMFRHDLAELKKSINIDREIITVLDSGKRQGEVKVSATISTYRLPSSDEERYTSSDSAQ